MDASVNSATPLQDILSAVQMHIRDAPRGRRILYLQNNWIYGNNDMLTIINGPDIQRRSPTGSLLGATLDTPDARDITSLWRRVPGERIVFEQINRIYGDNHRLRITNGPARRTHSVPGNESEDSYMYEQNNWIYGDNTWLIITNAPETVTLAKVVQNNWICGSNQEVLVRCGECTNRLLHEMHQRANTNVQVLM